MDYIQSANDLSELIEFLSEEITKRVINKYGIETMYDCIVCNVSEAAENSDPYRQIISVQMDEDGDAINGLRNLSGEMLDVGDHVRIYAPRDKISNGYVGVLCTKHE